MSFLLDTNVISELRKGARAAAPVIRWFASVEADDLFLSVLVLGEIRQGIERVRRRDPATAARLDAWERRLAMDHAERILPIDGKVALAWGRIAARRPLPLVAALLAATAIVHDLTLVTRNVKDVAGTGARALDPFVR